MSNRKTNVCGKCDRSFFKRKSKKVYCIDCKYFFHKKCTGMSNKQFSNVIKKIDQFTCAKCINKTNSQTVNDTTLNFSDGVIINHDNHILIDIWNLLSL